MSDKSTITEPESSIDEIDDKKNIAVQSIDDLKTIAVQSRENISPFASISAFENAQRMAACLAASQVVPATFQKNIPNCIIALELSHRIGVSIFSIMKHLYIVHGKPAWEAQFIIAALNSSSLFSPIRYKLSGQGDTRSCIAWATDKSNGEELEGPEVSISMAKAEGWYSKEGSKWKTMPEVMLRYRAASFFGKLYAPHIMMGMNTAEEVVDSMPPTQAVRVTDDTPISQDQREQLVKTKMQEVKNSIKNKSKKDDDYSMP